MHNCLKHIFHALARLCTYGNRVRRVQAHGLLNGFLRARNVGRGQIDLVNYGNDFETVVDGQIGVGQCLCLHALTRIHHQQRTLARSQGT